MSLPVVLKSGKNYITLVLDPELAFPDLLQEIVTKFLESEKFFSKAPIAIAFEGRTLSQKEQLQIMDAIACYTSVKVITIIEQNRMNEYMANEALQKMVFAQEVELDQISDESICTYVPCDIDSGSCISSGNTIVVMGSVAAGAMISSGESIIILGNLYGTAIAGKEVADHAKILVVGEFNPENYKIGNLLGDLPKKKKFGLNKRSRKMCPTVAYILEDAIQIDDFTNII